MLRQMFKIIIDMLALYIIQRFPDMDDWKNPHMMARIFIPLLIEMGWMMSIEPNGKVTLYYSEDEPTDNTKKIMWLEGGDAE